MKSNQFLPDPEGTVVDYLIELLRGGCFYDRQPRIKSVDIGYWHHEPSATHKNYQWVVLLTVPNRIYTLALRTAKNRGITL